VVVVEGNPVAGARGRCAAADQYRVGDEPLQADGRRQHTRPAVTNAFSSVKVAGPRALIQDQSVATRAPSDLRAAIRATMQAGVTATAVGGLGQFALETDPRRACVLLEAATAVLERTGVHRFPVEVGRQLDRARLAAERRLARPVAEACRARARAMSTGEALACALGEGPAASEGDRLTARQQEVALLVAEGRSNREISERLHLSVRTVESHVDNILTELGFHSRARLAAWVREAGLGDP
jgi:DNA-binding NarL/FixJ family response regulator